MIRDTADDLRCVSARSVLQSVRNNLSLSRRTAVLSGIALLLCTTIALPSFGASINYGDFDGTSVMFLDVTEESDKPLPLYGAPIVVGNSLFFSPQQFKASSNNNVPPNDRTDGHLTFIVMSKNPGAAMSEISFDESGAFTVAGFLASNTDDTYVEATGTGSLTVLEIDGDSNIVPFIIPIDLTVVFDPNGPAPGIVTNRWRFLSEGSASGRWDGNQELDITQALTDAGRQVNLGATKIAINFDNILVAQSELLGRADIDKKLFLEITTIVPEPASIAMVAFALFGLGYVRFGRRS